jgi:hypothetical protein
VLGFETFEEYCKKRWDFASNYARRLIASAATVENIKSVPIGTFPATEAQARSLAKIKDPGAQREAWQKAVSTARKARRIVQPGAS